MPCPFSHLIPFLILAGLAACTGLTPQNQALGGGALDSSSVSTPGSSANSPSFPSGRPAPDLRRGENEAAYFISQGKIATENTSPTFPMIGFYKWIMRGEVECVVPQDGNCRLCNERGWLLLVDRQDEKGLALPLHENEEGKCSFETEFIASVTSPPSVDPNYTPTFEDTEARYSLFLYANNPVSPAQVPFDCNPLDNCLPKEGQSPPSLLSGYVFWSE